MNDLPNDPIMLTSALNAKLRDFYPDLDALCEDLGADRGELEKKLSAAGFTYNERKNRFE